MSESHKSGLVVHQSAGSVSLFKEEQLSTDKNKMIALTI